SLVLVMVSVAALTGGEPWAARKQASYGYRRRKQKDPERVERGCYQPRQANGMLLAAETVFVDGSCDPGAVWARSPPRGEHG
ncbi:MAG TPA: hypothetical protein VK425_11110, partial [Acidimicrobiales bacterium]|nr:hypothetical protein [Acidimicrobiales bacterium]